MAKAGRKKRKRAKCAKCGDLHEELTYFRQCLLCPDCLNGDKIPPRADEIADYTFVSSALSWGMRF